MRIPASRIPALSRDMTSALLSDGDVESESPNELQKDIEAVLSQYVRDEQAVTDRARELLDARRLPPSELGKMKRLVADERKFKIGDEAVDYILDQLIEFLMHSSNVDEIYCEDVVLRRKLRLPLRQLQAAEESLEQEVRGQLKHVKEGTAVWDVEYRRMMEDIKRRKGL
ncbi:MAG: DUF507 family protein [Polyangiaceae bacterium]